MCNDQYITQLRGAYAFCKVLYKMSFKDRVRLKMGILKITVSPDREIMAMSIKELESAISKLKKPWWNWMF